ncbi:MAG: sigma-70 family RNA polymerase sigma factor [Sedimentisphaerales bacterium]|nr:sigma-70 family RNA polymerase sigma factor [Sedimentisphaerales bacterium]
MKVLEDRLLIKKFKNGDSDALRGIYDKYRLQLLKLGVVLTNDVYIAEDCVHDVFLSFTKSIGRMELHGSLKSYLATSVVNRIRNIRRNTARHRTSQLNENDCTASSEKRPEQWAILSEQLKFLSSAMAQLPDEQREVVALRIENNMAYKKIAIIQSVSANTVKGRYRYGIDRLRSILNGKI